MYIEIEPLGPIITLATGILILFFPKFLNYIVAIYFILVGAMGLIN